MVFQTPRSSILSASFTTSRAAFAAKWLLSRGGFVLPGVLPRVAPTVGQGGFVGLVVIVRSSGSSSWIANTGLRPPGRKHAEEDGRKLLVSSPQPQRSQLRGWSSFRGRG